MTEVAEIAQDSMHNALTQTIKPRYNFIILFLSQKYSLAACRTIWAEAKIWSLKVRFWLI